MLPKFALALSLLFTLAAQASTLTSDSQGMPICMGDSSSDHFLKFTWAQDSYARDVYAEFVPRKGFDADSGSQVVDLYQIHCIEQKHLHAFTASHSKAIKLEPGQSSVFGYAIDYPSQVLFEQVRKGGNLARTELTAKEYFHAHPFQDFTVPLNRTFTRNFGMGFSAELYKTFLEQDSLNLSLKNQVVANIQNQKAGDNPNVGALFSDTTFLVVEGYGHSLGTNARYHDMEQDMIDFGLDVKIAPTKPFGYNEENREIVLESLKQIVPSGKKIVILAASKGGLEALGAVSDLNSPQVVAFIGLSSISQGAFIVDWLGTGIKWDIIRNLLFKQFNQQGAHLTSKSTVNTLLDMSTANTGPFLRNHPISKIPVYLNLVGTPLGNGIVKDESILALQKSIIEPKIKYAGANDGYEEFPGTEIQRKDGFKSYTLAFDSSHAILDGQYEGNLMSVPTSRRMILKSILISLHGLL